MSDLREAYERINRVMKSTTDKVARRDLREIAGLLTALSAQPQPEAVEADQIQRAMDMLGDVPGNTILERVERIVSYYLALQCELEKVRAVPPLAPDERMRGAILASIDMIENCADAPKNPDSLPEMVKVHLQQALSGAADASNARAEAIELAYGLLWIVGCDRSTKTGNALYLARKALYEQIDKAGQARGITAAKSALSSAGADEGKESEGGVKAGAPVVSPEVEDTAPATGQSVGALHPSDPTPPDATAQREAIARIIDPKAGWDIKLDGDYSDLREAQAEYEDRQQRALGKADAILALQTRAGG